MCTVTIIPRLDDHGSRAGLRLGCNRDELHTRDEALPPMVRRIGDRAVLMPVDPASNGTWIAVNDTGLVATLLNVNVSDYREANHKAPRSRGRIIPAIMRHADMESALGALNQLDPADYSPFRVILTSDAGVAEVSSDGSETAIHFETLSDRPVMWTSSGLGDHLVGKPRRELFDRWFGDDVAKFAGLQDSFHRHAWPDRPHLSVCMNRPDARTVSYTVVETGPQLVRLCYFDDPSDAMCPAEVMAVGRREASVA